MTRLTQTILSQANRLYHSPLGEALQHANLRDREARATLGKAFNKKAKTWFISLAPESQVTFKRLNRLTQSPRNFPLKIPR
ncbi:MAG: hypothetical protein ACKO37_06240 [Vampirovibrionales bacterium]